MTPPRATFVALLAAMAWGLGNVAQKQVFEHLDGFSATGLSCLLGGLVLWPFLKRESERPSPSQAGSIASALVICVLFTFAATAMQFGYGQTSVTNAGFLVNTSAVFTPLIACFLLKQYTPLCIWPACVCTLVGVYLMVDQSWVGFSAGDAFCLMAAMTFALWTLLLGQHVTLYRRPNLVTAQQMVFCGTICMILGAITYGLPALSDVLAAWPELLLMGVMSKGLAYVLNAIAQQHISATCAAMIMTAEAVFGAILAAILLGETLSASRALGAMFILAGVFIVATLSHRVRTMPSQTA